MAASGLTRDKGQGLCLGPARLAGHQGRLGHFTPKTHRVPLPPLIQVGTTHCCILQTRPLWVHERKMLV